MTITTHTPYKEPGIEMYRVETIKETDDRRRIQPGYIFYAPFPRSGVRKPQWIGPHIIDTAGQLVWWGNATTAGRTQNLHPCRYLGGKRDHLCWSEATWTTLDHVNGTNHILDSSYTPVEAPFSSLGDLRFPNPHEVKTTADGKSLLNCVYELKRVDLTPYNGAAEGYVEDGCFQEIDISTREVHFQWCGLDSLELWHSYIFLNIPENVVNRTDEPYGKGTIRRPWDYFHFNSVEKTPDGNYVVSARHLNQVIKVAGKNNTSGHEPGSLVWRLGGKFNDFAGAEIIDLSRQHHVSLIEATGSIEQYSVFNNQWQTNGQHRHISNAQIFTLDTGSMTVNSTKNFYNPEGALSLAQGSAQVLPNGNVLVGWGTVPHVTEFSASGEILWHAHLDKYAEKQELHNMQNYRIFKYPWIGNPKTPPKLVVYSHECQTTVTSPLTAYVSWNGATEVRSWRFHTSMSSSDGPWTFAGTFKKTGFETKALLQTRLGQPTEFARYTRVEALDGNDQVIGQTEAYTYVPGEEKHDQCHSEGCTDPTWGSWNEQWNKAEQCSVSYGVLSSSDSMVLVCLSLFVAVLVYRQRSQGQWPSGGGPLTLS